MLTNLWKLPGLKNTWVQKTVANGKSFFDLELRKFGGNTVFQGNHHNKDIIDLDIAGSFVKEIIETYMVWNFLWERNSV